MFPFLLRHYRVRCITRRSPKVTAKTISAAPFGYWRIWRTARCTRPLSHESEISQVRSIGIGNAMRTVQFAFGKSGITVPLPDGFSYMMVENRSAQPLSDVQAGLDQALDHSIAGPSLLELAAGKKTAAISVCDITRPVPNSVTLPPLLSRLHKAGITVEGVSILIATGLHRPATEAEIRVIVGAEIASKYRILNHDAKQPTEHRWLGATANGTPVYIDERFIQADLHITLGFIEQHLMLGFSGGRK